MQLEIASRFPVKSAVIPFYDTTAVLIVPYARYAGFKPEQLWDYQRGIAISLYHEKRRTYPS